MQKVKKDHESCRIRLHKLEKLCYNNSTTTFGGYTYDKLKKQY